MKKAVVIAGLIAILMILVVLLQKPEVVKKIEEAITGTGKENVTAASTTTTTTTTLPSYTGNVSQTGNQTNASTAPGQKPPSQQNVSKEVIPEVVNLCLAKPTTTPPNESTIITSSKGMIYCLNQKYPYYLNMEINDSNLTTSVYNYPGTEQNFNLSSESTLYYLFVGDLSDVKVEKFYMVGNISDYFSIGDYSEHTVSEVDATGKETIKTVAILSFDVKSINTTEGWEEIKLYLKTSLKEYYLGDLFVEIK